MVETGGPAAWPPALPADSEAAARGYLSANRESYGLSEAAVANLELVNAAPLGGGHAVLLRQRFGKLNAGVDGLVTVGVRDGRAEWASSSLTRDAQAPAAGTLSAGQAVVGGRARRGPRRLGGRGGADRPREDGWTTFDVAGFTDVARSPRGGGPDAARRRAGRARGPAHGPAGR